MLPSVISIIFLFLACLKFVSNLSTIQEIRNSYGNNVVKLIRQLEKLHYKYRKLLLDLYSIETVLKIMLHQSLFSLAWIMQINDIHLDTHNVYRYCLSKTSLTRKDLLN